MGAARGGWSVHLDRANGGMQMCGRTFSASRLRVLKTLWRETDVGAETVVFIVAVK